MTYLAQKLADAEAAGWREWVRTEADERAVLEGCWFDLAAAERVRAFFQKFLRHSKGQWTRKPFTLLDWQWHDIVAPLFGWKRADGTRRYRRGYVEVPKKNGKSTLFSGLSLYLLAGDGEQGAEIYSAAVDRDQASIVYTEAANMVEASPALSSRLGVVRSTKRITFIKTRSFYRALSADVPAKEGLNAHAVLIDELHAQKTRELWDTLRYAGASRRQPLHLSVTTAGFDRLSICWEQQESPAKENSFRRYRLNQWTEQDVRWINMEKWDACAGITADLDKKECFGGLDLSSTTDLSAFVLVFPADGWFDVLAWFWVPEEGAKRRERRDRVPYSQWIHDEYIEATPGEAIDYDRIRKKVNELGEQYFIRSIAIDRWNATQLSTQLNDDGFEIVAFGQGFASMNWPTKKLEEIVLSGRLRHGGNPVLRWMAGNVSLETDAADNWKPSKKKSRERIDGIAALIMGLERASTQLPHYSFYLYNDVEMG